MGRRRIVRIQVAALVLLTLLVVGRSMWSSRQAADRTVSFSDIRAAELHEQGFHLDSEAQLSLSAAGSAISRRGDEAVLAAYAWIIDLQTREPVWVMRREEATRVTGTIIEVDTTITLPEGRYAAYFTSHGPEMGQARRSGIIGRLFRETDQWINDARRWHLDIRVHSESSATLMRRDADATIDSTLVWTSGPLGNRARAEELLEVRRALPVTLYAVGEISEDGELRDYAWLRDVVSGDTLWMLMAANTVPAGGTGANRAARHSAYLEPGLYAAGFATDARHAFEAWRANPPFDPRGWGLRIEVEAPADTGAVFVYDPWEKAEPVIDLTGVGNDADESRRFTLTDSTLVIVDALGEISRSRYDYGWIEALDGSVIWEMTEERSTHAGGNSSNRREVAALTLGPGEYRLRYRTDGSHAFGAWRHAEPRHGERWGVALFVLNPAEAARFSIVEEEPGPAHDLEERTLADSDTLFTTEATTASPPMTTGEVLVDLTGRGNEQDASEVFQLGETTDVFVRAVGEITLNNRFDYGWIEDAATGDTVWEMTYDNTVSAGGALRNRLYEGLLKLPAGDYRVRYISDFSHAFGDFPAGEEPSDPAAWGILIRRFE